MCHRIVFDLTLCVQACIVVFLIWSSYLWKTHHLFIFADMYFVFVFKKVFLTSCWWMLLRGCKCWVSHAIHLWFCSKHTFSHLSGFLRCFSLIVLLSLLLSVSHRLLFPLLSHQLLFWSSGQNTDMELDEVLDQCWWEQEFFGEFWPLAWQESTTHWCPHDPQVKQSNTLLLLSLPPAFLLSFRYLIQSFWLPSWLVTKNSRTPNAPWQMCETSPIFKFPFRSSVCWFALVIGKWLGWSCRVEAQLLWLESCRCKRSSEPWTLLGRFHSLAEDKTETEGGFATLAVSSCILFHAVAVAAAVRTSAAFMRIRADDAAALGVWSPAH